VVVTLSLVDFAMASEVGDDREVATAVFDLTCKSYSNVSD